jgi:hypothetical protein
MLNFCTLFDSNYLSRGVALYESLAMHCKDFRLYIFAFDDLCYKTLTKLDFKYAQIISLHEFEDIELINIKRQRTRAEYCWTCTPSIILYSIEKFGLRECTYLDADTYFYSSPKVLLDELKNDSVIITAHRYTPKYDSTVTSGKYCVQFMTFRNNVRGLRVLKWWRHACIDSCELNPNEGKCGDQKYLDDWTTRFGGVHELEHLGGGVAPWNVQQYEVFLKQGQVCGKEVKSDRAFEIVFFHYHALKFFQNNTVELTNGGYDLSNKVKRLLYMPYIRHLKDVKKRVANLVGDFDPHGARPCPEQTGFIASIKSWTQKALQYENVRHLYNEKRI